MTHRHVLYLRGTALTAAALAALRRSRWLAHVLMRIQVELVFALGAAEVIGVPGVLGLSSGFVRFYVHSAHRIFRSCCGFHAISPSS